MDDLNYINGITLTPTFLRITPNTGSPSGSLITATVKGVGINTQNVTLVDSAGTSICFTLTIIDYGVIQCKTKVGALTTSLSVKVGATVYSCLNTNG